MSLRKKEKPDIMPSADPSAPSIISGFACQTVTIPNFLSQFFRAQYITPFIILSRSRQQHLLFAQTSGTRLVHIAQDDCRGMIFHILDKGRVLGLCTSAEFCPLSHVKGRGHSDKSGFSALKPRCSDEKRLFFLLANFGFSAMIGVREGRCGVHSFQKNHDFGHKEVLLWHSNLHAATL